MAMQPVASGIDTMPRGHASFRNVMNPIGRLARSAIPGRRDIGCGRDQRAVGAAAGAERPGPPVPGAARTGAYEIEMVFTPGSVGVRAATSAYSYFVPGLEPGLPNPNPADSRMPTASRIW